MFAQVFFAQDQVSASQDSVFADGSVCMIADDCYSDLHKDVYGFRPRGWNVWASVEAFDAEYARLVRRLGEQEDDRIEYESIAYDRWIKGVHDTARKVNARVCDVIRWQFDADDMNVHNKQDREYFCYKMGMAYAVAEIIRKTQGGR